jgi:hypothetical protein
LGIEEQDRTGFHYAYSVYQLEYSRNLLFHRGSQLEQVFQRLVDRTRARLDVRQVKTLFGAKRRPHWHGTRHSAPRFEVVVETLAYDLSVFKIHFGNLTLKAYTKGERVLRIEAVAHNTQELRSGRAVARFPQLVARLHSMLERFMTTLDCLDVAFIGDQTLDQLPLPARVGKTRVGGVDLNNVRIRRALSAVLALAASPAGFSTAHFKAKVQAMTGLPDGDYTHRQAAYDLKKLRAKNLITRLGSCTPIPTLTPQHACHHRAPGFARARHSANPRRCSHTAKSLEADNPDANPPALRTPSTRHAAALSRARNRSIDNVVVDHGAQAPNGAQSRKMRSGAQKYTGRHNLAMANWAGGRLCAKLWCWARRSPGSR